MESNKLQRFNKLFPWYAGLSGDLLFWIAVDTLFLQIAKGFSIQQIVLTTTISHVAGIFLQLPLMAIVKKIGNTNAVRIGAFLDLAAALTLTFGNAFILIVIGRCLHEVSFSFKSMINVTLEHNLELQNKRSEYIKYSTDANTVYAVTTMVISAVASFMFNLNHYLPMMCCNFFCVLCSVMSFYMVDYNQNAENSIENTDKIKVKITFSKVLIILFIVFSVGYSVVHTGQENAKLFIQNQLLDNYSNNKTSIIVGVILFISRIVRVAANLLFNKIYNKMGNKVMILLCFMLLGSFVLLILGYTINDLLAVKYTVMATGYMVILFLRDPFRTFIYNLALHNSSRREHSQVMMLLELSRKIMTAVISLSFTAVLSSNPIILVIVIYAALATAEVVISFCLYNAVKKIRR